MQKESKEQQQRSERDESSSESDEELRSAKRFIRNYRRKVANANADYGSDARNQSSLTSLQNNLKDYRRYVGGLQTPRQLVEEKESRPPDKSSYIGRLFNLKNRKKPDEDGLRSYLNHRIAFGHENRGFDDPTIDTHHLNSHLDYSSHNHLNRNLYRDPDSHHHLTNQIHTNTFSNQQLIRELDELRSRRKLNQRFELENYFRQNFCNCQNRPYPNEANSQSDRQPCHRSTCRLGEPEICRQFSQSFLDLQRSIQESCLDRRKSIRESIRESTESDSSSCGLPDCRDSLNLSYMDSDSVRQLYHRSFSTDTTESTSESDEEEEEDAQSDRYLDTYTIESANTEENPISSESFSKLIKKLTYADTMRARLLELCGQSDALDFEQEFSKENYPTVLNLDSGTFAVTFLAQNRENHLVVLKVIRTISKDVQSRLSQLSYSGTETFDEVYAEVMISRALSSLHHGRSNRAHCFPQILYTKLVAGRVPENFQIIKLKDSKPEQFDCATLQQFHNLAEQAAAQSRATALNDRKKFLKPEPFKLFTDSPVEYTVIAMKYVGKPIWKRLLNRQLTAQQLFGIVQQLIFGLVCAERQFSFEHRDLHISNILIKRTKKPEVDFVIDNQTYKLTTLGYRCFIVDMTFSRLSVDERQVFFKDLSAVLYKRQENESKKLKMQDMVYQLMRDEIGDAWHKFKPRTNLHWLIYVLKTIKDCELFKRNNDVVGQLLLDYYNRASKCQSLSELIDYIVERSTAAP